MECHISPQRKGILHYHILGPKGFEQCHMIDYAGREPTEEELAPLFRFIFRLLSTHTGIPPHAFCAVREPLPARATGIWTRESVR